MMKRPQRLKYQIWAWGLSFILAEISLTIGFILGLPNIAHAQSIQKTSATEVTTAIASDAFRKAYENRYMWDEQFPGYSAEVSINHQGQATQGIVRVKPDLSVEVVNISNDELRQLIENQLRMEVIHRRRLPFEKLHGQNRFELEGTDESGALTIKEVGDKMDSCYKVQDNVITQVNRNFGEVAVTVDTLGTTKTPAGYLVTHFQTTFRDAKTSNVIEKQDVRDVHEKIGNYYLLTSRTMRSTKQGNSEGELVGDTLIRFKNIQPL